MGVIRCFTHSTAGVARGLSTGILLAMGLGPLVATSGCYRPELGEKPFLCAPAGKPCPNEYTCKDGVCVPAHPAGQDLAVHDRTVPDGQGNRPTDGPTDAQAEGPGEDS